MPNHVVDCFLLTMPNDNRETDFDLMRERGDTRPLFKPIVCDRCGEPIKPKTQYYYNPGPTDNKGWSRRYHPECHKKKNSHAKRRRRK